MLQKVRIITNTVSEGARALGDSLEALGVHVSRVRASAGPKVQPRLNIKWGCFPLNPLSYGSNGGMLNAQSSDATLNKLTCFMRLSEREVAIPDFTSDRSTAEGWVRSGCRRIYQRNLLRASEGDGIVVCEYNADGSQPEGATALSNAPLYTKGMFGVRREYRIHVVKADDVRRIFIQQKKRRVSGREPSESNPSSTIRNLENGWIFAHNDIVVPRQQTIDLAVAAIETFGLNFGGVDLIEMDDATKGSVVLEINCAPGLQGATLNFYATAIKAVLDGVVDSLSSSFGDEEPIEDVEEEEGF